MTKQNPLLDIQRYAPTSLRHTTNKLFVHLRPIAEVWQNKHSGNAYFVTLGLGSSHETTVEQEWTVFLDVWENLLETLSNDLFIGGVLVGFEMYSKNKTTSTKSTGKALRPHAHMVLFTYNSFLEPPQSEIEVSINEHFNDVKLDHLRTAKDVAHAAKYTVKSSNRSHLIHTCMHYFQSKPCALYVNSIIQKNPLANIPSILSKANVNFQFSQLPHPNAWTFTSIRSFKGNQKLQMGLFLRRLCEKQGIGLYADQLMRRNRPSLYTWFPFEDRSNLIFYLTEHCLPLMYHPVIFEYADWFLDEGSPRKKRGIVQRIFPRIQVKPYLWEFADNRIYDFRNGMIQERPVNPFISCSKYHEALWQQLPHPQPVVHLVKQLIAHPMELEPFLISLGALFHPLTDRKDQPAVWLWGNSNTFKTFFTKTFLEHNFSEVLIHYIEQSKRSQFKYGRIRGVTEGIILIDDFRDASIGQVTQFINVIDGQPVVLDGKYKQQQLTKFKGHPVITTNKPIHRTNLEVEDQSALTQRFSQTEFQSQGESWDQINELFKHITPNHWISFGIYVNRLYLKRGGCANPAKPDNWHKSLPLPDQQPQNANWHQWLNPFGFKT